MAYSLVSSMSLAFWLMTIWSWSRRVLTATLAGVRRQPLLQIGAVRPRAGLGQILDGEGAAIGADSVTWGWDSGSHRDEPSGEEP